MTAAPTDRRPAWDEVQELLRRDRERLDGERDAAVAASPARPAGVWRVCGRPLTDERGRGCRCPSTGPWPDQVPGALRRLAAPPVPRTDDETGEGAAAIARSRSLAAAEAREEVTRV